MPTKKTGQDAFVLPTTFVVAGVAIDMTWAETQTWGSCHTHQTPLDRLPLHSKDYAAC